MERADLEAEIFAAFEPPKRERSWWESMWVNWEPEPPLRGELARRYFELLRSAPKRRFDPLWRIYDELARYRCKELVEVLPVFLLACLDVEDADMIVVYFAGLFEASRLEPVEEIRERFPCLTSDQMRECARFLAFLAEGYPDTQEGESAQAALDQGWAELLA